MNEKERIIELVKQNIISMDEALDLLEAAGQPADIHFEEKLSQTDPERDEQEAPKQQEAIEDLNVEVADLKGELKKVDEAITVNQQRKRELDILSELDNLTEEMQAQYQQLEEDYQALLDRKYEIESQLEQVESKKTSLKEDLEEVFNSFDYNASVETARQFGNKLQKEGSELGRSISESVSDFLKNFDLKDTSIHLSLPSLRSEKLKHRFEYPLAEIDYLDISSFNGDIEVSTHDSDQIVIEADIAFYGKHERYDLPYFEEINEINVDDKKLIFKVKAKRLTADLKVFLPEKTYNLAQFQSMNGDFDLDGLKFADLEVASTNGDIQADHIEASAAKFEMVNGDMTLEDSQIRDLTVENVNGDLRIRGDLYDAKLKNVNSDFYITKTNADAGHLVMKTVNGDLRLAFPESMNLEGEVETRFGDIHDLIAAEYTTLSKTMRQVTKHIDEQAPTLTLEGSAGAGDIYIKYNESVID